VTPRLDRTVPDLAAVIGAVVDDLREADTHRRVDLPAVVELEDVRVGIELAGEQFVPRSSVGGERCSQLGQADLGALVDRL
jgi:hypothetical protein